MTDTRIILNTAVLAGESLIKSGGEIYRVEDTMCRILEAYNIPDYHVFVMSNGIFASVEGAHATNYSSIRHITFGMVNLRQIDAINQLSREICEYHYPPLQAYTKMKRCSEIPIRPLLHTVPASGLGCAAFAYLLGGFTREFVLAFVIGLILEIALHFFQRKYSKFFFTIVLSFMVTLLAVLANIPFPHQLDIVTVACCIPLMPGLTLTNSVRDFFNANYLSGIIQLIDAILTAVCIATGVGAVMLIYQQLGGMPI